MAESSNAKSINKSRPDQTQSVDRMKARIHANDERGMDAAARKGKAEAGDKLFPGPAPSRKTKEGMAESSSAKSVNKPMAGQTRPVDRVSARTHVDGETGWGTAARKGKVEAGGKTNTAPADKWKTPMVPQLQGIDERAEEFIAKFRQEMKLEREQSILDYEEMLKRSA